MAPGEGRREGGRRDGCDQTSLSAHRPLLRSEVFQRLTVTRRGMFVCLLLSSPSA